MAPSSVLLVAEEQAVRNVICAVLQRSGHQVSAVSSETVVGPTFNIDDYKVAIVAQPLVQQSIVDIINNLKDRAPELRVILLADQNTRLSTIETIHDRLFTFHIKPLDYSSLANSIQRASEEARTAGSEMVSLPPAAPAPRPNGRAGAYAATPAASPGGVKDPSVYFLGASEAIHLVRHQVKEVAPTDMTVLIRGESGVGKGVVASLIHATSGRGGRDKLVHINCTAIPEALFESELFGHEAGAFTGADRSKPGRLEFASGGTIFLDEIGEIQPGVQAKLLHVIEQKEIFHLGGNKPIKVDVRFVTATNASLEQLISIGRFRADLFYRLNEYTINIPPLRERIEDIPILAEHFLWLYKNKLGRHDLTLDMETVAALMRHKWPGNVRELESVIRRFALSGNKEMVLNLSQPADEMDVGSGQGGISILARNEMQTLLTALTEHRWNQRQAAKSLGISYSALRRRIEKYRLKT